MRRAAKIDANHREIVDALRATGWSVLDLARMGRGCPDLLIRRDDDWRLVEIKTTRGKVTRDQAAFIAQWPVNIVRTVNEALALRDLPRQRIEVIRA